MDITALQSKSAASVIPFDKLAKNPTVSDQDKIKESAKQFEAVLLRQILGEARKSSHAISSGSNSNVSGIYDDMVTDQVAESISKSGAFGLAKSLQTQLAHQVLPKPDAKGKLAPAATPILKPTSH